MLWEAWQKETRALGQAQREVNASTAESAPKPASTSAPIPQSSPTPAATKAAASARNTEAAISSSGERIKISTDLVKAEIDPVGGTLAKLEFLAHKDSKDAEKNFELLGPEHRYSLQSGLTDQIGRAHV